MTVSDLIAELRRMPNQHAPVRVVTSGYYAVGDHDPQWEPLSDEDATEADDVRHMGPWVLIQGK